MKPTKVTDNIIVSERLIAERELITRSVTWALFSRQTVTEESWDIYLLSDAINPSRDSRIWTSQNEADCLATMTALERVGRIGETA